MNRDGRNKDIYYSKDYSRPRTSPQSNCLQSRIYIGNMEMRNVTHPNIYEWMRHYGRILDIAIFERHLLVQFDRESDARDAIDRERGRSFQGSRFDIRFASFSDGEIYQQSQDSSSNRERQFPNNRNPRDRSLDNQVTQNRFNKDEYPSQASRRYERPQNSHGANNSQLINQPDTDKHRKDLQEPTYDSTNVMDVMQSDRPRIEAAVIIMSNELQNYAGTIEYCIDCQIGLKTITILLKEESHVNACVEDLHSKGVLYAFLINSKNQEFTSCTLRILHGTFQEHRNMPLSNAISYITRHFDSYQKQIQQNRPIDPNLSKVPPGCIFADDNIINNILLIANDRTITLEELNNVMEFVDKRINALTTAEETLGKSYIPFELPNIFETETESSEQGIVHPSQLRLVMRKPVPNPSSNIAASLRTTEPHIMYNKSPNKSNMNISPKPKPVFNATIQSQFNSNISRQNTYNNVNNQNVPISKNSAPFNQYSKNLNPNMRPANNNPRQQIPTTQRLGNNFHGYQHPQSAKDGSHFPPGNQLSRHEMRQ